MNITKRGNSTNVVLNGQFVKRPLKNWSSSVHLYLEFLNKSGLENIPKLIRVDKKFEYLTQLPGETILRPWPSWFLSDTIFKNLVQWGLTLLYSDLSIKEMV